MSLSRLLSTRSLPHILLQNNKHYFKPQFVRSLYTTQRHAPLALNRHSLLQQFTQKLNFSAKKTPPPKFNFKYIDPRDPLMLILFLLTGLAAFLIFRDFASERLIKKITWQDFRSRYLTTDSIAKLDVNPSKNTVNVYFKDPSTPNLYFTIPSVDSFERNLTEAQNELGIRPEDQVMVTYRSPSSFVDHALPNLLTLVLILITISSFRKISQSAGNKTKPGGKMRGLFDMTSPATVYNLETQVNTSFKDVAGMDEAKQEILEFVEFLKNPKKYEALGAKIPKGALLVGPPGTGKTLLAKATAGEAGVPFFSISGSEFMEMYVGVGPLRVRELFKEAKQLAPSIIFIDEIDAIGRSRSSGGGIGGHDERDNTLNQLLVEMDGFKTRSGVIVLAGTNQSEVLDKALLRAGRFDRHIVIDKPDIKERYEIFKVHLKKIQLEDEMDEVARQLAARTPGFAGADIMNVCNEGAIRAARTDKKKVTLKDFEDAIERVIAGLEKKNKVLTPTEKKTVAYHEAGHAIVGWLKEHTSPVIKVSIIPRGSGILGYVQNQPKDQHLYSKEMLFDQMCCFLGGRVSESIFFGKISTGAVDDLQKVTEMAYSQVALYGMNSDVGPISFPRTETDWERPYSQATARMIDDQVRKLVAEAYDVTYKLIQNNKHLVEKIAQQLLSKEVLTQQDMVQLVGERPFPHKSPYQELNEAIEKQEKNASSKKNEKEKADAEQAAEQTPSDSPSPSPA